MNMQFEEERVVCKDHMQIIRGKRTKRQRLPSPLRLAMPSSSSSSGGSGGLFDLATATATTFSPSGSNEFRRTEIEDDNDEDMANCLILLAQGHHHHNKASKSSHEHVDNKKPTRGLYIYECKTCSRCFPSFQALGGHRASHKKPKTNNIGITEDHQKQVVTSTTSSFVDEDDHHNYDPTTSTTLTLQISNRPLSYRSSTVSTPPHPPKSKVHECSICGAEFTSGQALGGHMRRHRAFLSMAATTTSSSMSGATNVNNGGAGSTHESQEKAKKAKNVLKLDLNLPAAPEDDHRESNNKKFSFQSKEKVIVFSATSLVDCHY